MCVLLVDSGDKQSSGPLPGSIDPCRPEQGLSRVEGENPEVATHLCGNLQTHRANPNAASEKVS